MDNPPDFIHLFFRQFWRVKTVNAISIDFFHLFLAGLDLNLQVHILKRVYILDFLREISRNPELLSFQKLNGL